jgi:hypothetical protein
MWLLYIIMAMDTVAFWFNSARDKISLSLALFTLSRRTALFPNGIRTGQLALPRNFLSCNHTCKPVIYADIEWSGCPYPGGASDELPYDEKQASKAPR